jgi:hypothetical protein
MTGLADVDLQGLFERQAPVAPAPADDRALFTTAVITAVDAAGKRVQVKIRGGDVWLPANPSRYAPGALARVLVDPSSTRPVLVMAALTPLPPMALATVSGSATGMVTLTFTGVEYTLPGPLGTYTAGQSARVLLDDWGIPVYVLGPSTITTVDPGPPPPPAPVTNTVSVTVTLGPQTSGTYRTGNGWDRWNTGKYGGASDIYQGSAFNSGLLIGFAGYGDQIVNLGAISIEEITMAARKTSLDGFSAALTVQGSGDGGRPVGAPTSGGDTASTPTLAPGASGALSFTAPMREAFRVGGAKGLCAVGGAYGGFGGTGTPGSFVLTIRYTKNV